MGGSERPGGRGCSDRLEAGGSVVEVGGQRRVEHKVWDRLGLGRDEANESSEKLDRREHEFRATIRCRLGYPTFGGQAIEEPGLGRGEGNDAAGSPEPFEREGRPGTVAEQAFDACPVLTLDAYRGVDAEPTGTLPGKHAVGVDFVE